MRLKELITVILKSCPFYFIFHNYYFHFNKHKVTEI